MRALRARYHDGKIEPLEMIPEGIISADVVIIFIEENPKAAPSPESMELMRAQEWSGFAQNVLGDSDEDIWNDL